jgi:predicted outer membrane protein
MRELEIMKTATRKSTNHSTLMFAGLVDETQAELVRVANLLVCIGIQPTMLRK